MLSANGIHGIHGIRHDNVQPLTFHDLPTEIQNIIIGYLDDYNRFHSLAVTCSSLNRLCHHSVEVLDFGFRRKGQFRFSTDFALFQKDLHEFALTAPIPGAWAEAYLKVRSSFEQFVDNDNFIERVNSQAIHSIRFSSFVPYNCIDVLVKKFPNIRDFSVFSFYSFDGSDNIDLSEWPLRSLSIQLHSNFKLNFNRKTLQKIFIANSGPNSPGLIDQIISTIGTCANLTSIDVPFPVSVAALPLLESIKCRGFEIAYKQDFEHFVGKNLESLDIHDFSGSSSNIPSLNHVAGSLQSLRLGGLPVLQQFEKSLVNKLRLKNLQLDGKFCEYISAFSNSSELESLTLYCPTSIETVDAFPALRKLTIISGNEGLKTGMQFLNNVVFHVEILRVSLVDNISVAARNFTPLHNVLSLRAPSLKSLELDYCLFSREIVEALNRWSNLEVLSFNYAEFLGNASVFDIGPFESLLSLRLADFRRPTPIGRAKDFINFLKKFPDLKEVVILAFTMEEPLAQFMTQVNAALPRVSFDIKPAMGNEK
jgi:hypothetical protein